MRLITAILLGLTSTAASAAIDPRTVPTKLEPAWQAKTRDMLKELVEIPSVVNRGQVPKVAEAVAARLRAAGSPRAT